MKLLNFYTLLLILKINLHCVLSANDDEITALPGLKDPINFKQYSGYLNITDGKHYFYWFFESQTNPQSAPLVLWLNGGPGCSSLFGNLGENGPFRVNTDGKTLTLNKFSWNSVANVLYLESPVGTGFSYKDDGKYHNTDVSTAVDNHLVLEEFFKKYPQFKQNPFYITGESYAGIYIPMLAKQIFSTNSTINLKGLAIGNGLISGNLAGQALTDFYLGHGLVTTDSYERKIEACCECRTGQLTRECDFSKPANATKCGQVHLESVSTPNAYNIYDDCGANAAYQDIFDKYYRAHFEATGIKLPSRNELRSNALKCPHVGYVDYLNLPEVRKALHVRPEHKEWYDCGGPYSDWGTVQHDNAIELINKYNIGRFVVYNGNFDSVCNFIEDQRFVDALGFKKTEHYKEWTADGSKGGVIGGFVEKYEKGLSFVVVRGAGHMVPYDQPEAALQVLKDLIGASKL